MKGVIVQIGEPKSIVLFNNGKIRAIPTPLNCHVGMVVTVKYNHLPKILIAIFTAALLIALGVFIGVYFLGGSAETPLPDRPWPGGRRQMMERLERHHPERPPLLERSWGRRHRSPTI
ncbi:MAG: hypothetical protein FWC97_12740 [Treponema sp.]|nr:hypothetical protein [Treponema sp.]